MDIEWDPRKAAENLRKHGVDFADAVIALEDENALTIEDTDHEEQRFKTLGMDPSLNVLYVIHASAKMIACELFQLEKQSEARPNSIIEV